MTFRHGGDRGQAFPIYVMMVVGLLFLAFAFFAVGKASAVRNGAQGAADAAALAAAQDARDRMGPAFLAALLTPNGLGDFLDNSGRFDEDHPCYEAQVLAAKNDSDVIEGNDGCSANFLGDEITVEVRTRYTVGESVIPGTERRHGTAKATAAIDFRCLVPRDEPDDDGSPGEDEGADDEPGPITLDCAGEPRLVIDPTDPDIWKSVSKTLFTVHLVDAG
ncbi:pilus assembly protein TadG-related protein [Streptomyces sp. NPDC059092]|uniref:pilus assembly protein TadG-related protein n=1 Tax=Streptomyces sp. NPDC059092 TaxID=3346725 RepID=UPI0036CC811F